jgi:hypothetical protein
MTLGEAWARWFEGPIATGELWDIPLFWWGRIGAMMQMIAAAAILVEIIGPVRLREFAKALRQASPKGPLEGLRNHSLAWYRLQRDFGRARRNSREEAQLAGRVMAHRGTLINAIFTLVIVATMMIAWSERDLASVFAGAMIYGLLFLFLTPFLILILSTFASALGIAVHGLIVGIAWILERRSLDKTVKLVSLLLLLAGFHFSLLAS